MTEHTQYAFPLGNPTDGGYDGMTLRQWYAGQALTGLIAQTDRAAVAAEFARQAFKVADAMIAAEQVSA